LKLLRLLLLVIVLCGTLFPVVSYAADYEEVSIPASGLDYLGGRGCTNCTWSRLGQRLTLNGTIYKVGYRVCKVGLPTGNVTLSIRDSGTDEVIWSEVWGDASSLPGVGNSTYCIVNVTPPIRVDSDVRICVEYYGGDGTSYCRAGYYSGDRVTEEWYTNYFNYATDADGWNDIGEAEEGSYYLAYIPVASPLVVDRDENGLSGWLLYVFIGVGAILATFTYVFFTRRQRSK